MENSVQSMAAAQEAGQVRKPVWRTPTLSTDPIADATRTYYSGGIDAFVETTTPSAGS